MALEDFEKQQEAERRDAAIKWLSRVVQTCGVPPNTVKFEALITYDDGATLELSALRNDSMRCNRCG